MSTAMKVTLVAAGAVIVGYAAYKLITYSDDDRNPIRVGNKKLFIEVFETDWEDHGAKKKWKVKHANGKSTTEYSVIAYGAEAGCLDLMKGATATITYKTNDGSHADRTLTFGFEINPNNNKSEPVVTASDTMTADNTKKPKKLEFEQLPDVDKWAISQLVVGTKTCTFTPDRRVLVDLCMHNCGP